jgi:hypothetical protein
MDQSGRSYDSSKANLEGEWEWGESGTVEEKQDGCILGVFSCMPQGVTGRV